MVSLSRLACVLLLSSALAVACGDDAKSSSTHHQDEAADASASAGAIVVAERVFSPEGRTYYVSVFSEMPSGTIDRSQAREFGSADIEVYGGKLYVRDRESNTVTRFKVSSDRQLVEEDRVSFANLGLTNNASVNDAYVSDTSAFIMSKESWSLIEWNPTTMEITGKEVPIGFAKKDGIDGFINDAVEVGGQIMAPVFWQDSEQYLMYPGTGVILIDPKNSSEPKFIEDSRIASGWKISGSDNGDAYVLGQVFAEFRRFGGAYGGGEIPASGVLRIRKGEQKFDPDYKVDLDEITHSPNIWAMHRIDDRYLLVQMWDPENPPEHIESQDDLDNSLEYIYAMVDTENKTWKRVEELPKGGAGNSQNHRVDGRLYIQVYVSNGQGEDGQDAVVYSVTADGFEEAFRVPSGDLWFASRVR